MPIDIDTFERSSEEDLGDGPTQPDQVLSFLAANPDQAYTPSEIAHRLDIPQNSIGVVLKRLADKNLVRHKGDYWAITDDEHQLRGLTQYELATETANQLYGEEDIAEWAPHMPDAATEDDSESVSEDQ